MEVYTDPFYQEALRIIDNAEKKDILLRLMGACAIMHHCPKYGHLYEGMKRALTDVDLMSYSKNRNDISKFLKDMGYEPYMTPLMMGAGGVGRQIFYDKQNRAVDVFFDRLKMCHIIDFRGRLELDNPTIPLADILLEKMQIVKINEKDIKDTIIMTREHDVGEIEKETINAKYIRKLLSEDWGFYYTVTTNLKKVKDFLGQYPALTDEDRSDVSSKMNRLLEEIEKEPKSFGWKMRARVGPSKKWYTEVEEVAR